MDQQSLLPVIRTQFSRLKICSTHDKVYKDECVYSFDNPFCDHGLYVNVVTWQGVGADYLLTDANKNNSVLYLHQKWTQVRACKDDASPAMGGEAVKNNTTNIASALSKAAESPYDVVKKHFLVVITSKTSDNYTAVSVPLPNKDLPEFLSNCVDAIISNDGMRAKLDVSSYEVDQEVLVSKYADGLEQIKSEKKISQNASVWRCEMSGDTHNLWLNLSTGYIGGGRKNWDGSGGSGAALKHFIDTGKRYPLCVKLGTITAKGGDVWSYADDEDTLVKDPKLAEHLSFWGIDIMMLEKTDKSLSEMEVDLNMSYDWKKIMSDGAEMQALSGPGLVGLRNIGSSCYMNSVLQMLVRLPEIEQRYLHGRGALVASAPADPSGDFISQFSKIVHSQLTDKYAVPLPEGDVIAVQEGEDVSSADSLERYNVSPRMFKAVAARGHADFSSGKQQDASEYFTFLLDVMSRAEAASVARFVSGPITSSLFEYQMEYRFECQTTGQVKYKRGDDTVQSMLSLIIPVSAAVNKDEVELTQERKKQRTEAAVVSPVDEDVKLLIPFKALLAKLLQPETVEMCNPSLGAANAPMTKTTRFGTFPKYLVVQLQRYYVNDKWVQVKIDARVPVPESLDLSAHRGTGLREGEQLIPEDVAAPAAQSADAMVADEGVVMQLVSMGFSDNGSRRAALATGNADAEAAMSWVLEHMDDPGFNDPPAAVVQPADDVDSSLLATITEMGYTDRQARAALRKHKNNMEAAMDWIFSNMDDLETLIAEMEATPVHGAAVGSSSSARSECDDGSGKYSLMAFISHIGRNTDHGHYVCHVKRADGWVLFNDEKVAKLSSLPPLDYGFMYMYKRDD